MSHKTTLLYATLAIAAPVRPMAASPDTETYRVDLTGTPTLAAFFEAGLVPRRETPTSRRHCWLTATRIQFIIDGVLLPAVDFDRLGIDLLRDHQINRVAGRMGALPLAEAEQLGVEFCEALGLDEDVITSFADGIRQGKEVPRTGAGYQHRFEGGSITFGLGQPPSWDQIHEVGFGVTITFPSKTGDYSLPDEILRPPPGYEHLSMEPYSDEERAAQAAEIENRLGRRTRVAMGLDEDADHGSGAEADAGAAPDAGAEQPKPSRGGVRNTVDGDPGALENPGSGRPSWRWVAAALGIISVLVLILVAVARSRGRVEPRK